MVFSDPVFFAFFAVYFALHLLVPAAYRIYLIIAGSSVFYAWWRVDYLWVPYLLTIVALIGVPWISGTVSPPIRRRRLAIVIAALFAPLVLIKYSYFMVHSLIAPLTGGSGFANDAALRLPLPLGLSFVTFTLTAYVVDVYRGQYPPEQRAPFVFGYVLFFPHLIAGPILRPRELMPQLRRMSRPLKARFTLALAIFTLGLVKKLVFADQIAGVVDQVWAHEDRRTAWESLLAIYGFSMQIYCDFSGYTDMAIAVALALRIRLPENFVRPYAAPSVIEFWRRWHITLSYWLRDYLYIPLGGKGNSLQMRSRNLMITMVLGGLWHGANWTFVVWGALHGAALSIVHWIRPVLARHTMQPPRWLGIFLTFNFVTWGWIYFRAPSVASAHRLIRDLFPVPWPTGSQLGQFAFPLLLLGSFALLHRFDSHAHVRFALRRVRPALYWPAIGLCWLLAITLSQGSSAKFIYFDF